MANKSKKHFCVGARGRRRKRGASSANLVMNFSFVAPLKTSGSVRRRLNRERKKTEASASGRLKADLKGQLVEPCREESLKKSETHIHANSH